MSFDPNDLDELLGAYALDAVDDDERRAVEAYLAENPRARGEVEAHREVATYLAMADRVPTPDGLWDRIAASLDERPPKPGPELAKVLPLRRRRWVLTSAGAALVGAAAALLVVLAFSRTGSSPSEAQRLRTAYEAAASAPTSRAVDLASTDGRFHARAVVTPSGTGFVDTAGLPAPPEGSAYQLWGINGSSAPVSLGLVPATATMAVFTTNPGAFDTLAITQEASTGVQAPTAAPIVAGTVRQ